MQEIRTSTSIDAPISIVWDILMDFDAYPEWNPFVTSIAGSPTVGQSLTIELSREGKKPMAISPTVQEAESPTAFGWVGSVGIKGLFDGHHRFELAATPSGTTLTHSEEFSGVLAPVVLPAIRKGTTVGFESMNDALRQRAEAASRQDLA
ncbi:MAG: SRPBCC domain-containing protein [Proteobacteria bacterium]|nr:SRPBCC domain-containing protein [Pseudomonadota bacterium]